MRQKLIYVVIVLFVGGIHPATAQNVNDFIRLFGNLAQSAINAKAAKQEWKKLPPDERDCIDRALMHQGGSIQNLIRAGIQPSDPRLSEIRSTCQEQQSEALKPTQIQTAETSEQSHPKSPYTVDGLALGESVHFESAIYKSYKCTPSKLFPTFNWCQRETLEKQGKAVILSSNSLLHRSDGAAEYINRYIRPAFITEQEANTEIDRLSGRFGEKARISELPPRSGLPRAVIASWGKVELQPVEADVIAALATGKERRAGLLIDFLGDFEKSAKLGLPVFRLGGGPGYVWNASFDEKGVGHLRFMTVDASTLSLDQQASEEEKISLDDHSSPETEETLSPAAVKDLQEALQLVQLASQLVGQGRYSEAESLYKRSLAIRERALGPNHPDVAQSLSDLASLYELQGRYVDADALYQRAQSILENALAPNNLDVAKLLSNLAGLRYEQGRYVEAEALYKRALAVFEKALGPNHLDVAKLLGNLAAVYEEQGRYPDAEALCKRSLAIREKALGPNDPDVATLLNNLANVYVSEGRYVEAEPLLKRVLTIWEKALGREHPDIAIALSNLANVYFGEANYADAEAMYKRALAIDEKQHGRDHPAVASDQYNLAAVYYKEGRYVEAEPLYKRSLEISEKTFGRVHPHVAQLLNSLALLYMDQSRYAEALPLIRRAIEQGSVTSETAYGTLTGSVQSRVIEASASFAESYKVLQSVSSSAAAEAVKKLAQRFAAGTGDLADLVRKEQDLTVESDKLDKALLATFSRAPSERRPAVEEDMRKRLEWIEVEKKKLEEVFRERFPDYVALANPQPLTLQETQNLLTDNEAVVAFEIGDRKSYAWVVTNKAADWREIPTDAKVLDEEIQKLRQPLNSQTGEIFDSDLSFRIYQQTFEPISDKIADKTRLSVFANGALTSIPPGILITSDPKGKTLKNEDWLIKKYAVTILPSIYSLKIMRAQMATIAATKPMIAFADPVYSKEARADAKAKHVAMRSLSSFYRGSELDVEALAEHLQQLPGTRDEVETIANTLGIDPDDIKLGLEATEKSVKQSKLDDYRIVYFATHGLVAGDLQNFTKAKAEPALALTIPDKPSELDDGLLQASEVAELKLNAEWVVLSACNTASSDGVGAEPLSGLARAFLYAGGKSLVVSHWPISDAATAKLMSNLFEIAKQEPNLSHGEMMRDATLALLDSATTDEEANPLFWGPFVVVGEPAKQGASANLVNQDGGVALSAGTVEQSKQGVSPGYVLAPDTWKEAPKDAIPHWLSGGD
jgi:CHAT domain-containing protein/tetratricopeptide (TPR) repeat protein